MLQEWLHPLFPLRWADDAAGGAAAAGGLF